MISRIRKQAHLFWALLVLFALQPAARAADSPPIRFAVYGDTRDGYNIHRKLLALILKEKPAFVLQTGDMVVDGSDHEDWKMYDELMRPLRDIPIYGTYGNHDLGSDELATRMREPITSGNKLYYSFDRDTLHVVCVDAYKEYGPTSEQYKWLVGDLAQAHSRGCGILVFMHKPVYSPGPHGGSKSMRSDLRPLFEKFGVTAVFSGHDHLYYRTVRHDVLYIVTGGGGAPLVDPNPKKETVNGDRFEKTYHFVACEVHSGVLVCRCIRSDGSQADIVSAAIR